MKLPERVETTDIRASDGVYAIMVNDAPLLTPKGHPVRVTSWELANAMADELMVEGVLDLQRLTLYSLYATQRDFIADRVEATIGAILQHLPGDFILHPDADPALAAKQLAAWAPLLASLRDIGIEVPVARPLQEVQIPWELTEAIRMRLIAMNPAQLTVVMQAVSNLGSVSLGLMLAQLAIEADQAVAALTATASHMAGRTSEEGEQQALFVAETQRVVRRLLRYVRLNP
jgi:chaperone required for assembly of F1-ATPase